MKQTDTFPKPPNLYDREAEWETLLRFANRQEPGLRLGIVYGRRRFGKSFLLRRFVEAVGGAYHLALSEESRPALDRFASNVSKWTPQQPARDWLDALGQTVNEMGMSGTQPQVLVIDEFPYLQQASPDIDSAVQALMDEAAAGSLTEGWTAPVSIILCGSAMSVMTKILSGASPMRGRAVLDMPLYQFDFRQARGFWGIADVGAAFALHSVIGGAAGYKDLTADIGLMDRVEELPEWLAETVLNPSHVLFRESEYLLREDLRISEEATYYSLLQTIASGRTSPTKIAQALGKTSNDIKHHLKALMAAGFVFRHADALTERRPLYRLADPIVRFQHLVNRRHRARLEDRRAFEVWADVEATYRSQIVGPHFEALCRLWADRYASGETLGGPIMPSASLQVNDRRKGHSFELDVVALGRKAEPSSTRIIQVIGEATVHKVDVGGLERLDQIAELLMARSGVAVSPTAKRLLFSLQGFTSELKDVARARPDVELVDLVRLYEGS